MNYITDLIALEESKGLVPMAEADKDAIESALDDGIVVSYDNNLKVWNEGGQYIADLIEVEK